VKFAPAIDLSVHETSETGNYSLGRAAIFPIKKTLFVDLKSFKFHSKVVSLGKFEWEVNPLWFRQVNRVVLRERPMNRRWLNGIAVIQMRHPRVNEGDGRESETRRHSLHSLMKSQKIYSSARNATLSTV
jgi:hypothetical protein